jgi:hypothetical protein
MGLVGLLHVSWVGLGLPSYFVALSTKISLSQGERLMWKFLCETS